MGKNRQATGTGFPVKRFSAAKIPDFDLHFLHLNPDINTVPKIAVIKVGTPLLTQERAVEFIS
ncbi:MAG: hypothetical protein R3F19_14095 [Verrucomicrobiales bacterium]